MASENDPFASFAAPREQLSPVEIWKRRRHEELQRWRRLKAVAIWLLIGTILGCVGAAVLIGAATGSLAIGAALLTGSVLGMLPGAALGWLVGFGSWGGRLLRQTGLVAPSEVPVPLYWLAVCSGIGLVGGANMGGWALPFLLFGQEAANLAVIFGPVGATAGAAVALVWLWRINRTTVR